MHPRAPGKGRGRWRGKGRYVLAEERGVSARWTRRGENEMKAEAGARLPCERLR